MSTRHMTGAYLDVCSMLALPELAGRFIAGQLHTEWTEPAVHRRFPPALVPLFQRHDSLFGYWKHWFVPERELTIVKFNGPDHVVAYLSVVETLTAGPHPQRRCELLATEIACSIDQLTRITLLDWLCNGAGEWTDRMHQFASMAGIGDDDIRFIDQVALREHRPVAFLRHPLFRQRTPLACHRDDLGSYVGDFPHPHADLTARVLRRVAAYELHSRFMYEPATSTAVDLRDAVAARPDAPEWLRQPMTSNIRAVPSSTEVFELLLHRGELGGAWLCLNAPGWKCLDAVRALRQLASRADDSDFGRLVQAYTSLDHDSTDWY